MGGSTSKALSVHGFGFHSTADEIVKSWDGTGKVAIVTGANVGLGKETARALASKNCEVIMACRDVGRGQVAAEDIKKLHPNARLTVMPCDISSLESVRHFADAFLASGKPLHSLINNAGIMMTPLGKTKDGFELQFGNNFVGHFALTNMLLPKIKETAKIAGRATIVCVSSAAENRAPKPEGILFDTHRGWDPKTYSSILSYGQSKLGNLLHARELQKRLVASGDGNVVVSSLHPGVIATELVRHFSGFVGAVYRCIGPSLIAMKTIPEGAATQVFCATHAGAIPGAYHDNCQLGAAKHPAAYDDALGKKLYDAAEEYIKGW